MDLLVFFITVVIPLWLVCLIYRNYMHLRDIPMPPCNLITGHIFDLVNTTDILNKLTNLTSTYGGIIRIYIPPIKPSVVVTSPNLIQLLTTSEQTLAKSMDYRFVKDWLGEGLLVTDVNHWRINRRMINPCFGRLTMMMNFFRIFEMKGNMFIRKLENEMDNTSIDIFPFAKSFTMDVMCESSMGASNIDDDCKQRYFKSIRRLSEIVIKRVIIPFRRYDFLFNCTRDSKTYYEELKTVEEFFEKIMIERKSKSDHLKNDSASNFLDILLQSEKSNNTKYIREEVNTLLFGGHDTTATALAFTLYALSRNPEVQDTVLAEQIDIFGKYEENQVVSYSDLQQMTYLELVINESLRMYPPIPVIGRRSSSEIRLDGGLVLPKHQSVCIFIYGCHHNPKYFPEPEKFMPERFQSGITSCSFIPFSNGPRNCVGKKFALLQLKSCISKVVRHFKILRPKPDYEIELVPHMTLVAKNGIRISLEKRVT